MVHLKRIGIGFLFWFVNLILSIPLYLAGFTLVSTGYFIGLIVFAVIVWYINGALIEYLTKEYFIEEIKAVRSSLLNPSYFLIL